MREPPIWVTDPERRAAADQERAKTKAAQRPNGQMVINPRAPYDTARLFRNTAFAPVGRRSTLHYHRGSFYLWNGSAYLELADADLRSHLYDFLDRCVMVDEDEKERPFKPTARRVSDIIDALKAAANLSGKVNAPAWLDVVGIKIDPADIIACSNGLLHLPRLELIQHSPAFFNYNALSFPYDAEAALPTQWLAFLDDLWPEDPESIATLQEIFGLCLTTETRHQKAFLLIGPRRSGKGTIGRVLVALANRPNTASPTLASLGERFGLQPLIGKLLAVISDARIGAKVDQHAIAEAILRITGEDDVTSDRKHKEAWTGRMQTRFFVISNELPRLADASGAFASRFIILRLIKSFYGREDQTLTDRLLTELPGILNWSLEGLDRLKERGCFVQPASAAQAVQELEDLSSPINAFIRERCLIGPTGSIETNRLFEAWIAWCKTQGRDHPGTIQSFGKELRAAFPALTTEQHRAEEDSRRLRFYQGISLQTTD
jgi:putative DNA primase/helicase